MARLLREVPDAWFSVSATTRAPREGEIEGVSYVFINDGEFDELLATDGLLEWTSYSGNRYGSPRKPVEEHVAAGDQVIFDIDMRGAFAIREKMPEAHLIFIEPPSLEELERRLRNRGTETEDQINRRLQAAVLELERKMEYDIRLVNDDLDVAAAELIAYVNTIAESE